MSLDPYSPCPCMNGKKLKFCCLDIAPEMEKIVQLQRNGQSKAALKQLDKLYVKNKERAWVSTSRAGLLLSLEEEQGARDTLAPLIQDQPNHPLARILDATAAFTLHGYDSAKSVIHQGFLKAARIHPDLVGNLAAGIAELLEYEGHYMAARQHLVFAMRLVDEEDRQRIFVQLMQLDNNVQIPFPFRSIYRLMPYNGNEQQDEMYKKCQGLSAFACWSDAAKLMGKLIESDTESAALYYNRGLFHCWDGNEAQAAADLHQAAKLMTDAEHAVEAEMLAQVLDHQNSLQQVVQYSIKTTAKLSRLLDKLDETERFARLKQQEQQDSASAVYAFLDRPQVEEAGYADLELKDVPRLIGHLGLVDADEEANRPTTVTVMSISEQVGQTAIEELKSQLADLISSVEFDAAESQSFPRGTWSDYSELDIPAWFPPAVAMSESARLTTQRCEELATSLWPEATLTALEGKTPQQAKGEESLQLALKGALQALDVFADERRLRLPLETISTQLELGETAALELTDGLEISSLSTSELLRLDCSALNDDQLRQVLSRALLVQHQRLFTSVLELAVERPAVLEQMESDQVFHAATEIALLWKDRDLALRFIQYGKQFAGNAEDSFQAVLPWEIRELQLRSEEADDPELNPLLERIYNTYVRKLPQLGQLLSGALLARGITPPWAGAEMSGVAADASAEGIWTPDATSPATPEQSKLWVPGQS